MKTLLKVSGLICLAVALGLAAGYLREEKKRAALWASVSQFLESARQEFALGEKSSDEGIEEADALDSAREGLRAVRGEDEAFADRVLGLESEEGRLLLGLSVEELSVAELEGAFFEWMARDLEDHRALALASRTLRELAKREPQRAVELLSAMSPAERGELVTELARGWAAVEPQEALAWIDTAWLEADGSYIDRAVQNRLSMAAMEALLVERGDFDLAAAVVETTADPELRAALVSLVARSVVRDGPEKALARLAEMGSAAFDVSIMDEVAVQWAARDGEGAATWALQNEGEFSEKGVQGIAKQLGIGGRDAALQAFWQGLGDAGNRDAVAAEVARVKARRDPRGAAEWASSVEDRGRRQRAVFDALYELGYDDFDGSISLVNGVYEVGEADRAVVLHDALQDWIGVDLDRVVDYLGSGNAHLPAALSEDLLQQIERKL